MRAYVGSCTTSDVKNLPEHARPLPWLTAGAFSAHQSHRSVELRPHRSQQGVAIRAPRRGRAKRLVVAPDDLNGVFKVRMQRKTRNGDTAWSDWAYFNVLRVCS